MSRIGKKPVALPKGVTATIEKTAVRIKGPKGEMSVPIAREVTTSLGDAGISVAPRDTSKRARAMWGMQASLIKGVIHGVSKGYVNELELQGTGYKAQLQGKNLKIQVGFSHDVIYEAPPGIEIKCPSPTEIVISGIDKQKVGQVAAEIRSFRPPEPYKGKGIRHKSEYVYRKEGKKK